MHVKININTYIYIYIEYVCVYVLCFRSDCSSRLGQDAGVSEWLEGTGICAGIRNL